MPQLGCIHEEPVVRETAIQIYKYETTNRAEIVRILISHGLMTPPPAIGPNAVHTALKSAQRKVQRWISSHQDKEKHEYMSIRQKNAHAKRIRAEEEAERTAKRVRSKGMSLAERNFMVALLTTNPETPTSTIQFHLSNRFGSSWKYSTIQHNRKQAGFNAKRTSPVNRASDPVTRNQYKLLWEDLDLQLWQCVFM